MVISIRTSSWLRKNFSEIDRVIYRFANSPLHVFMLNLLEEVPGVVFLDDFFLGDLFSDSGTEKWQRHSMDRSIIPFPWLSGCQGTLY